jgi:hypothetical protein
MHIGENFKRVIEATLAVLDEALCEFEEWAKGRERRSVFYSEKNTLSDAQRDAILSEVAGMREILRELQDDLGLEGRVRGGANDIWGKCAVLAVNLEELKGEHLARYGNPPPELVKHLDPRIKRLIVSINRIFQLVDKSRIGFKGSQ